MARNSRRKKGDLFKDRRLQVYVDIHNYGKRTILDRTRLPRTATTVRKEILPGPPTVQIIPNMTKTSKMDFSML